jgi:hypothetical protein
MNANEIVLRDVTLAEAKATGKQWHFLHREMPELYASYIEALKPEETICWSCEISGKPVAVMIFGPTFEQEDDTVIELRGFCISDDAPANTGSKVIAIADKKLHAIRPDVKRMVTYSLPGRFKMSLYKGSNFEVESEGVVRFGGELNDTVTKLSRRIHSAKYWPGSKIEVFTDWYIRKFGAAVPPCIFEGVRRVGKFSGLVMYRSGPYQAELWIGEPGADTGEHSHPNIDSIQFFLSGNITFFQDGKEELSGELCCALENQMSNCHGKMIRTPPGASHRAICGDKGGAFINFQYWPGGTPGSAETDWEGKPMDSGHAEKLHQ